MTLMRSRWAAIGAAVAVTLGAGGLFSASAAGESVFVDVEPVRILDSRPAFEVGLSGPFLAATSRKLQVTGTIPTVINSDPYTVGDATVVPAGATSVVLNVTAIQPTDAGFISVRPGDATGDPTTSNLNLTPGQIVPNAVTVSLPVGGANDGQLDIQYFAQDRNATVDIAIDVVGYHMDPSGLIPSGKTVTGNAGLNIHSPANGSLQFPVSLPGKAAAPISGININFHPSTIGTDDDATCTGTATVPTAPPGKVCIYPYSSSNVDGGGGFAAQNLGNQAFYVSVDAINTGEAAIFFTWAYTEP